MKSVVATLLLVSASSAGATNNNQVSRNLIVDEICAAPLASLLGNQVSCSCDFGFLPPSADVGCRSAAPSCVPDDGLICGSPSLSLGVDFFSLFSLGFPVSMSVCFKDITAFSLEIPAFFPVCIAFGDSLLSIFGFNFFGLLTNSVSADAEIRADEAPAECGMSIGDKTCSYCQPCKLDNGEDGIIYDCSDIVEGLVATTCSSFGHLPTTFGEVAEMDGLHFPLFDVLESEETP